MFAHAGLSALMSSTWRAAHPADHALGARWQAPCSVRRDSYLSVAMESTRSLTLPRVPGWTRFAAAHLHDYTPRATALWLTLAIVGAFALGLACVDVARRETSQMTEIAAW